MQSHANLKLVNCIVMSAAFKLFEFSAKTRRTISESCNLFKPDWPEVSAFSARDCSGTFQI